MVAGDAVQGVALAHRIDRRDEDGSSRAQPGGILDLIEGLQHFHGHLEAPGKAEQGVPLGQHVALLARQR
ncbi:MAG: hypothetical protein A2V99_00680 [Spirochaetes bacterium RBG_16_67_19]|nr:MAG: hypothetical protein A2V99_00680 [Spirochaetes bacterium RBG_16_67_19]